MEIWIWQCKFLSVRKALMFDFVLYFLQFLVLDFLDIVLVSAAFVVRNLGFELGDLLGVLPVKR